MVFVSIAHDGSIFCAKKVFNDYEIQKKCANFITPEVSFLRVFFSEAHRQIFRFKVMMFVICWYKTLPPVMLLDFEYQ